jgi:hypothetical protein
MGGIEAAGISREPETGGTADEGGWIEGAAAAEMGKNDRFTA